MTLAEYNLQNRERKFDMSKLTPEEADSLGLQINEKVQVTSNRILEELNKFLKIYGIQAKVQVALEEIKKEPQGE